MPASTTHSLSADGVVTRLVEGDRSVEIIDDSDEGPSAWTRIDQTCFVPRRSRTEAVGFTAVAGSPRTRYMRWDGRVRSGGTTARCGTRSPARPGCS